MNAFLAILSAVVNSFWQALAVAGLVWLVLRFAPQINAATRYAIWWATLGVVLILPVAPRLIQVIQTLRSHPKPAAVTAAKAPKVATPAVPVEPVIVTVPPGRTAIWPMAVLAVWAAILLWRLFQIVRSYFYLRGVKRRAAISPIPFPAIPRHADLLISPDIISPMAVGFLRPAVVLPESLLTELSEPEREHVLLHESAHLAKYDDWSNLAMRLLAGALALHPVAIWILWRIEREREMACDDWVVARTGAARPYAASLAHLFELRRARRGEILASGIFGSRSRIGDRIDMLLRRGRTFSPRASASGVIACTITLGALTLAGSLAPRWIAFAQTRPRPAFEVASVKLNTGGPGPARMRTSPGTLTATNVTLGRLIAEAYSKQDYQISGSPGWVGSERYDIVAKAEGLNEERIAPMLQGLLEERFQLKVHPETKEGAVYALTVGKSGFRLREENCTEFDPANPLPPPAAPGFRRPNICNSFLGRADGPNRVVDGAGVSMEKLTGFLARILQRTVVDRTGFAGQFDVHLEFTVDQALSGSISPAGPDDPGRPAPPVDSGGPSIFTALQEQLGLKLESTKGPVEILVVDHVEKPDAN